MSAGLAPVASSLGLDLGEPERIWVAVMPDGVKEAVMFDGTALVVAALDDDELERGIIAIARRLGERIPALFDAAEISSQELLDVIKALPRNVPHPCMGYVIVDRDGCEVDRRYAR